MATATIMVQQVDGNNDPVEGEDGPVFLSDVDAVAQIIMQSLRLLAGEWWENTSIGLPLVNNILGGSNSSATQEADAAIFQQTIAACPYVQQILSYTYSTDSSTRKTTFTAQVQTQFGTLTVTNVPADQAAVFSS